MGSKYSFTIVLLGQDVAPLPPLADAILSGLNYN